MENKPVKRMLSQDIAKGICILSVVMSHTMRLTPIATAIFFSVFSFSLSFFFIISGYNYHGMKTSYGKTIWKRFKQLFIPFFIILGATIIIYGGLGLAFVKDYGFKEFGIDSLESFTGIHDIGTLNSNLIPNYKMFLIPSWFVWYMFGGYVIFYAVADWALAKKLRTFLTMLGLIAITFVLSLFENLGVKPFVTIADIPFVRTIVCSPFVAAQLLLGAFLGKYKVFSIGKEKKGLLISTTIAAFVITTAFGFIFPMVGGFSGGRLNGTLSMTEKFGVWEVPITFIIGFLFTYYFVQFCRLIEKIPFVNKGLAYVGQNSLIIYMVHFPLGVLVRHLFNVEVNPRIPFPVAFVADTFEPIYIAIFFITATVCVAGVYGYNTIKKVIKNKKAQKVETQQAN